MLHSRNVSHLTSRYFTFVLLAVAVLLLVACTATASPTPKPATGGNPPATDAAAVEQGKQLFQSKGCVACHMAPGISGGGNVGPALAGFANQPKIAGVVDNNPTNLRRWLLNPQAVKPGTQMPNLGLTEDEAAKLSAFLETLK